VVSVPPLKTQQSEITRMSIALYAVKHVNKNLATGTEILMKCISINLTISTEKNLKLNSAAASHISSA